MLVGRTRFWCLDQAEIKMFPLLGTESEDESVKEPGGKFISLDSPASCITRFSGGTRSSDTGAAEWVGNVLLHMETDGMLLRNNTLYWTFTWLFV